MLHHSLQIVNPIDNLQGVVNYRSMPFNQDLGDGPFGVPMRAALLRYRIIVT
jgi:hypothetical protein